jgi:hypothetical protein
MSSRPPSQARFAPFLQDFERRSQEKKRKRNDTVRSGCTNGFSRAARRANWQPIRNNSHRGSVCRRCGFGCSRFHKSRFPMTNIRVGPNPLIRLPFAALLLSIAAPLSNPQCLCWHQFSFLPRSCSSGIDVHGLHIFTQMRRSGLRRKKNLRESVLICGQ